MGAMDWTRAFFQEAMDPTFNLRQWEQCIAKRPATLLTDCKSVFDSLNQPWTSGAKCDKRTSIDLSILRDSLTRDLSRVRWVDTRMQLVDNLTKNSIKPTRLRFVMAKQRYIIVEETDALAIKHSEKRKRAAASKDQEEKALWIYLAQLETLDMGIAT